MRALHYQCHEMSGEVTVKYTEILSEVNPG
jgi:hypothetical protein